MTPHPLDRPVWSSLTTCHAHRTRGDALARRIDPAVGLFIASADRSPASLAAMAALIAPGECVGMLETMPWPVAGGLDARVVPLAQMVATDPTTREPGFRYRRLGDDDAPAMLALATATEPGPFFAQTHRLGSFYGVEDEGGIVAMAGMRLAVPGFTEISGVCTLPTHRGRGYAGALMQRVARDIAAQGDACFLHVRAANKGAIALYESLGFAVRAAVEYTIIRRD